MKGLKAVDSAQARKRLKAEVSLLGLIDVSVAEALKEAILGWE